MSPSTEKIDHTPTWARSSTAAFQKHAKVGDEVVEFPGIVQPSKESTFQAHLETLKGTSREGILALLKAHGGAILFRGFGLSSAAEFSDFAHALRLGPQPHVEVGRPPRRTILAKAVSTANEGPPDSPIWVHNEYGWSLIYPSYVLFFALHAPEIGESVSGPTANGQEEKLQSIPGSSWQREWYRKYPICTVNSPTKWVSGSMTRSDRRDCSMCIDTPGKTTLDRT